MAEYSEVEEITASPQFGNSGPQGWGFHLRSSLLDDEAPHRPLLERFGSAFPQAGITLPEYDRYEDCVECHAAWNSSAIWIYYETILGHLWLWSADRDAVQDMRAALLSFLD